MTFTVPPARLAFTDRAGRRVVEPGELRVWVGASVDDLRTATSVDLVGEVHAVTPRDERWVMTEATRSPPPLCRASFSVLLSSGSSAS